MKTLNDLLLAGKEAGVVDFALHVGEKLESGATELLVKSGDSYADVVIDAEGALVKHSSFAFLKHEDGECCGAQHAPEPAAEAEKPAEAGEAEKPAEAGEAEKPAEGEGEKTEG